MIFSWFGDKPTKDFASSLAQDLFSRFPPPVIEALMQEHPTLFTCVGNKKSASKEYEKLSTAISRCYLRAKEYKRDNKLGVLKTARLGKSFQDELINLGYRRDFVQEVTLGLVKTLT